MVNQQLKQYIENTIMVKYKDNNYGGHGWSHIEDVINRSFELMDKFNLALNPDMVYVIAAYHDIGYKDDPDNHEEVSSKMFMENETMKEFFSDEERRIIAEAITDHRASLEYEARSDYGKLVSSADRAIDVDNMLKRSIAYQAERHKDENPTIADVIEYSYKKLSSKYGQGGYAKMYFPDDKYEAYLKRMNTLFTNKDEFIKAEMELILSNPDLQKYFENELANMSIIDRLSHSYKYVCDNSKNVSINYQKIDEMISKIKKSKVTYWLDDNPHGMLDMDIKSIIDFLFIYHAIGDYCFWGEPKWEIQTEKGQMDGSYAIIYLILNRYKKDPNFEMSFDQFKEFLKGNVTIPLLENRYQNLEAMNAFLKQKDTSFYELIKDLTVDSELLSFIVNSLPYYEDVSTYNGNQILFYKRAQLLTSDILHVRKSKEGIDTDYSHLIGCADYKIPQVMRCYGMLEFSDNLANLVDSKIALPAGSSEEIEIRANTLKVIEYIYEKLDKKYSRMDINDFIWLLGQDKTKMTKPYHRTLTSHY